MILGNDLIGIVLCGGKSQRMGQDKALMKYHGIPQWIYVHELLSQVCRDIFVSCRAAQLESFAKDLPQKHWTAILDEEKTASTNSNSEKNESHTHGGVIAALNQIFQKNPLRPHLVVACDLPLLREKDLQQLLHQRNTNKPATAFVDINGLPEPMVCVWEPEIFTQLKNSELKCPRKFLLNTEFEAIVPKNPEAILNINTILDAEKIFAKMSLKI